MIPALRIAAALTLSTILTTSALAENYLVAPARQHQKRFNDGNGNYNISIYHINDVHAHLDEFVAAGTDCVNPAKGCLGGYARVKEVLDQTRQTHPDSLFLNMGDEFQGTLFYTFYKGEKIAETLNQLGFDAMTLGNHEFDGGDDQLGAFVKNLTFPVVCANVQTPQTELNSTIVPYHVFEKQQLAVIGVTTETIPDISNPGPDTKFSDPVAAVQATVDHIKATEKNVTRLIAMTHIGYEKDIELAKNTRGIHLVVGGHSHTLLGDMAGAAGPYPTIAQNLDGDDVFVVTAYRWGEYLGYIDVAYDSDGKIVAYTGGPIHLTNQTAQDEDLQSQIKEWRKPFEAFAAEVIGSTENVLSDSACKSKECLLGDVMADAMFYYRNGAVDAAMLNGGGVRATITAGDVTRGQVITSFPFGNAVADVQFTGEELWKIFEGIASQQSLFNDRAVVGIIQVSKEIHYEYNPVKDSGSCLISLTIGGKPVDFTKTYTIAATDYMATGGDNELPARTASEIVVLDTLDEVLAAYMNKTSPITAVLDGRVTTTDKTSNETEISSSGQLTRILSKFYYNIF